MTLVDCPICFEKITDPKVLDNCKHSMCHCCFQQLYFISNRCPICRVEIISQKKAETELMFKISFSMETILKHLKRLEVLIANKEDKQINISESVKNCKKTFNSVVSTMQDVGFFEDEDEFTKELANNPNTELMNDIFSFILANQ
jgi:hypothetical protein